MILLDTDHVTILSYPNSQRAQRLQARLNAVAGAAIAVSIVTVEEKMRGWLAAIAKEREVVRQVAGYRELTALLWWFGSRTIAPFDQAAAEQFALIRHARVGTMDKKIASIALTTGALLLTANRRDFALIEGLRFDDWSA